LYRILVVDDNKISREGIAAQIRSDFESTCEVNTAADGLLALNIALTWLPDILVTDLRMPYMNGIELSDKLHAIAPEIKIIFFSSYTDKEYLKAAIRIQAISYLEKPVNVSELRNTVSKCISSINKQKMLRNELSSYQNDYSTLISSLWCNSLCRPNPSLASFTSHFERQNLQALSTASYRCIILESKPADAVIHALFSGDIRFLSTMDIAPQVICFLYANQRDLLWDASLSPLLFQLSEKTDNARIVVGQLADDYASAYLSYQTALEAQDDLFFDDSLVHFYHHHPEVVDIPDPSHMFAEVKSKIFSGNNTPLEATKKSLQALATSRSEQCIRLFAGQLIALYFQYSEINCFDLHRKYTRQQLLDEMSRATSFIKVIDLLEHWASLLEGKTDEENIAVRSAISYINLHYADQNLSVGEISAHCGYSASHMRLLFKKHTGATIRQQITNIRIEHVKQALLTGKQSLESIAVSCGYQNARYLCHVFKGITGITPFQYKEEHTDTM